MTPPQLGAIIGFLFIAAWAALGFGDAILCLLGSAVGYVGVAVYRGEMELGELTSNARSGPGASARVR